MKAFIKILMGVAITSFHKVKERNYCASSLEKKAENKALCKMNF